MLFTFSISIILFCAIIDPSYQSNELIAPITSFEILVGEKFNIEFYIQNQTSANLTNAKIIFAPSQFLEYASTILVQNGSAQLEVTGVNPVANGVIEAVNCSIEGFEKCPLNMTEAYASVTVIRSKLVDILVDVVGWMYFFAWSISFYPQILLNFKRKSVIGLNFDFLALNLIGFGAYAIYNLLMYFNDHVQMIYHWEHPRSPPPVLMNDVVFAVHAFLACSITIVQCIFYEKENQKVSSFCIFLIIGLISFGTISSALALFDKISILQFVTSLSYIKMVVTCSKYFPQAIFNYQRQSTVGWSIGNILLDFTGGVLDILQMILQAINVDDGSAFYANPVKFGLGLVSIVFDVIFMFQHYVLYRNVEVIHYGYEGVENPDLIIPSVSDEVLDDTDDGQPIVQNV